MSEETPKSPRAQPPLTKAVSEKRLQIARPPPPVPKKDPDAANASSASAGATSTPTAAASGASSAPQERSAPVVPPKVPRKNLVSQPPITQQDHSDAEKLAGILSPRGTSMAPQKQPPALPPSSSGDLVSSVSPGSSSDNLLKATSNPKLADPTTEKSQQEASAPADTNPPSTPLVASNGPKELAAPPHPAPEIAVERPAPAPADSAPPKQPAAQPGPAKQPLNASGNSNTLRAPVGQSGLKRPPSGSISTARPLPPAPGGAAPAGGVQKQPSSPTAGGNNLPPMRAHSPSVSPNMRPNAGARESLQRALPAPPTTVSVAPTPSSMSATAKAAALKQGAKKAPAFSGPLPAAPAGSAPVPPSTAGGLSPSPSSSGIQTAGPGPARALPRVQSAAPALTNSAPANPTGASGKIGNIYNTGAPKAAPTSAPPPTPAPPPSKAPASAPGSGTAPAATTAAPATTSTPANLRVSTDKAITASGAASGPSSPSGSVSPSVGRQKPPLVETIAVRRLSPVPGLKRSPSNSDPPKRALSGDNLPGASSPTPSPSPSPAPSDTASSTGNKTPDSDASRKSAELSKSDSGSSLSSAEEKTSVSNEKRSSVSESNGAESQLTLADLTSPPASPRALHAGEESEKDVDDANFVYRTNIVRELHKTEQFYVKGLTNMLKVFVLPLRELALRGGAQEQLISVDDLKVIFSNVDVLLNVNKKFLDDLTVSLESWSPTAKVAPVLLKVIPFLKVYSQYINNFNAALAKYEQCMKVKRFKKFVDDVMTSLAIMDLDSLPSYLIMPIQRIPRYQLLIQELLKKTDAAHPDHEDLQLALSKILQLAEEMNSSKRDSELIGKVADVQKQLIFPEYSKRKRAIVTALRRYIREVKAHEIYENNDRSAYNYLFLFNDCLIVTKPKKKGHLFHLFFYIRKINFSEAEDPEGDASKGGIKISSEEKKVTLLIVLPTVEERDIWMKDLVAGQQHTDQQRALNSDDEDDAKYQIEREKVKQEKKERSAAKKDVASNRRRFKTLDFKRRKDFEVEAVEETEKEKPRPGTTEDLKVKGLTDELKDLVAKKSAK